MNRLSFVLLVVLFGNFFCLPSPDRSLLNLTLLNTYFIILPPTVLSITPNDNSTQTNFDGKIVLTVSKRIQSFSRFTISSQNDCSQSPLVASTDQFRTCLLGTVELDSTQRLITFTVSNTALSQVRIQVKSQSLVDVNTNPLVYSSAGFSIGQSSTTPSTPTTPSSSKDITSFSIPALGITGNIVGTNIFLVEETITSFTPQIANFATTGASVSISGTPQVSGVTANTFSSVLNYTVTAQDGSTQNYKVIFYAPRAYASSNLKAWFKGNSLALANGALVTSWTDSSGTGNTVTTGAANPTFVTNGIGGQPAVNFVRASNQFLQNNTTTGLGTTSFTTIAAVRPTLVGAPNWFIGIGTGCSPDKAVGIDGSNLFSITFCGTGSITDTVPLVSSTNYILTSIYRFTGSAIAGDAPLYKNGTLAFNGTSFVTAFSSTTQLGVGTRRQATTESFNGLIAEILYYDTNLSTATQQQIECYLSYKYGISVSQTCF